MEEEKIQLEDNSDDKIMCCMHSLLQAEIYCKKCGDFFCRNCEEFHQTHNDQLKQLHSLKENKNLKQLDKWLLNFETEIKQMKEAIDTQSDDSWQVLNNKTNQAAFDEAFREKRQEMVKQFEKVNQKMQNGLENTIQTIKDQKEAFSNCLKMNIDKEFSQEEQVAQLHQRYKTLEEMNFFEQLEKNLKKVPESADNDTEFQNLLFNQLLNTEQDIEEIAENIKIKNEEPRQSKKILRDQNLIIIDK